MYIRDKNLMILVYKRHLKMVDERVLILKKYGLEIWTK